MTTATMPETTAVNLTDKTVCLKVEFSIFGNTRKLRQSQYQVEADKSMVRANKKLLDSKELEDIRSAAGELRRWVYDTCLPFEEGIHFVPIQAIPQVETRMKAFRADFDQLVSKFVVHYSELRQDAQQRLNGLFNPADYPSEHEISKLFSFSWRYLSFAVPGQLAEIDSAIYEQETAKAQQKLNNAVEEITGALRGTFAELVAHLKDTLTDDPVTGKRKKFYESTVTKLRDFINSWDFRNVLNDDQLAEQVQAIKALLGDSSIEAIKTTDTLRDKLRNGTSQVCATLETLVASHGARVYRDED
jgi:hypothetical protein